MPLPSPLECAHPCQSNPKDGKRTEGRGSSAGQVGHAMSCLATTPRLHPAIRASLSLRLCPASQLACSHHPEMKEAVRHEREIGVLVDNVATAAECILARESQSEGERESDTERGAITTFYCIAASGCAQVRPDRYQAACARASPPGMQSRQSVRPSVRPPIHLPGTDRDDEQWAKDNRP